MNNKEDNSTPKDKSITDTVEDLFDDFFAPKKPDESHDSQKKEPVTTSPEKVQEKNVADKPLPKKISPNKAPDTGLKIIPPIAPSAKSVQKNISPKKPVISKKEIPPVQPGVNKPAVKQDIPLKEKESPPKDLVEKVDKKIPMKTPPKITKTDFKEVFSKYFSHLIFAVLIILLVILSMFIGRIMDYDGIFKSLNFKNSSASIPEPVSTIHNRDKKNSISKDDKTDPLKESPAVSNDIKNPGTVKQEQEEPDQNLSIVLEKRADVPSNNIAADNVLHPYSIYLGSYNTVASVKELSSNYMKMGIISYWIKLDLGEKGVWYRLYVGCFQKREEADEFIKTWKLPDAESKNTKYANLIGSYTSKEDAEKHKADLEKKGYSAYIIIDTEDAFRLYTGAFYQQKQAEALKIDLELNGIKGLVVKR